jgi:hypothetical protein
MIYRRLIISAVIALSFGSWDVALARSAARHCLDLTDPFATATFEGRLVRLKVKGGPTAINPTGIERPLLLRLSSPVCATSHGSSLGSTSSVQVQPVDDTQWRKSSSLIGRHVIVFGQVEPRTTVHQWAPLQVNASRLRLAR